MTLVITESLSVLVELAEDHLPCAEVKRAQVHRVAQVTSQLGFASELLSSRTRDQGGTKGECITQLTKTK